MSALSRELVEYGRRLLQSGFVPIPICPDSKQISFCAMDLHPYHTVTARKYFRETAFQSIAFHLAMKPPSGDMVQNWLERHAGNLGVVTGYNGLIVLDFDDPAAFGKWAAANPLHAQTPTERTKAGYHVYLRCLEPLGCSSLYMRGKKGGHIKGFGGYVVCAPSSIDGCQVYRWLDGKSPFEVDLVTIADLSEIGCEDRSPLRFLYERLLARGYYMPDEKVAG